jgi:hypothetical protein
MMTRLMIQLDGLERSALTTLAELERRDPRQQAALLIRQQLERLGLLQPTQSITQQESGNVKLNS